MPTRQLGKTFEHKVYFYVQKLKLTADTNGKGKGKGPSICHSTAYMRRLANSSATILEVAAD